MTTQLTRRALVAGAAATVPVAALAPPSIASDTDQHSAWLSAWRRWTALVHELGTRADHIEATAPDAVRDPRVPIYRIRNVGAEGEEICDPRYARTPAAIDAFFDIHARDMGGFYPAGQRRADFLAAVVRRRAAAHAELRAEQDAADAWRRASGVEDLEERVGMAMDERAALFDKITVTPARCREGLGALVALLVHHHCEGGSYDPDLAQTRIILALARSLDVPVPAAREG